MPGGLRSQIFLSGVINIKYNPIPLKEIKLLPSCSLLGLKLAVVEPVFLSPL